jgi:hypothetical protein
VRQLTAGLAITALVVAGCSSATTAQSGGTPAPATSQSATTATGVVEGTSKASPGSVSFQDSTTGSEVIVRTGTSGKFRLRLPAGAYTATGQITGLQEGCASVPVIVRAGTTTHMTVSCNFPTNTSTPGDFPQ